MGDIHQGALRIAGGLVLASEAGDTPQIPFFWVVESGRDAVRSLTRIHRRQLHQVEGLSVQYTWSADLPAADARQSGELRLDLRFEAGDTSTRPAFLFEVPELLPALSRLVDGAPYLLIYPSQPVNPQRIGDGFSVPAGDDESLQPIREALRTYAPLRRQGLRY